MTNTQSLGERIALLRRRRGFSQEVLAGLIGRTTDWLSKVENNKIALDRVSVIRTVAEALDVSLADLLGEPTLLEWTKESGRRTIPAVRAALMDYRQVLQVDRADGEARTLAELRSDLDSVWSAYQDSRFAYVTNRVPELLADMQRAANQFEGDDRLRALGFLALTYQVTATTLTKVGEVDLSWIAADRGLTAARKSERPVIVGSLYRAVTHSLLATGRFTEAVKLGQDALALLDDEMGSPSVTMASVYGALLLAGSMASARAEDRSTTKEFLDSAESIARKLGTDRNELWTAFGPTNVVIHRVSTAMELGDVRQAIDLAPTVDPRELPTERQVRHALELSRAYSTWNRRDEALSTMLDAEQLAPEQVRYHFLSRHLVQTWIREQRTKPSYQLAGLAERLRVA